MAESSINEADDGSVFPTFRPTKRPKLYRKRESSAEPSTEPPNAAQNTDQLLLSTSNLASELSVTDILRQRKVLQRRLGGIKFSTSEPVSKVAETQIERISNAPTTSASTRLEAVGDRFAPQTGQVADVDKHMMAFIDAELARRRIAATQSVAEAGSSSHHKTNNSLDRNDQGQDEDFDENDEDLQAKDLTIHKQPAALGKLLEIDLGPDARAKNHAATQAAQRRLNGEIVEEETTEGEKKRRGKVRLGPDGKPWRGRKRKGSDAVRIGKFVDEILRENKIELYDESPSPPADIGDEAADDRLVAEFCREYWDNAQSKRPPTAAAKKKAGKEEEKSKGPKLGGSRMARAAMREKELAEKARAGRK